MQLTPDRAPQQGRRGFGPEDALLCRYAVERTPELREELVHRLMPLARSLASRYRRQTESFDDLLQVAGLGLVKAIDGYDPEHGRPFTAYAVPTILGELRRHFRDHVWNLRLPRGLQEMTMKVDEATASLTEELGRAPTAAEVAERTGASVEQVLEAIEAGHARRTVSLDAPRSTDEPESAPAVEALPSEERGYDRVEAQLAAESAGLDGNEWRVLQMRFAEDLTQSEIGRELGVSQMQISRVSRRALWKLLVAVRAEEDGDEVPPSSARAERSS